MPFFGHREQRLGQEIQALGMDAQLAGSGSEEVAVHADDVAQIQAFLQCEIVLTNAVLANVDLQPLAVLLQMSESGLAHAPDCENAAGHAHGYMRLQLLGGLVAVLSQDLLDGVGEIEAMAVGLETERLDFSDSADTLLVQLFFR
jgi:hypothetical protein